VNNAIDALVTIIADASASDTQRDNWLERLWRAVEADDIPYIELLPDHWGNLCVTPERASRWADEFIAARDMAETEPRFAVEAGVASLRWMVEGHGYEITGLDVRAAYGCTIKAAENAGCKPETFKRIRELVAGENFGERFVTRILGHELGL